LPLIPYDSLNRFSATMNSVATNSSIIIFTTIEYPPFISLSPIVDCS